jgi:hypothetical protein
LPKKALWFIAAGIAGLLYVTWDAGRIPARVTLMNQSGSPMHDAVLMTSRGPVDIGTLRNGESRALTIPPTDHLVLTYRWQNETKQWRAIQPLKAGQPISLSLTPNGRVAVHSRVPGSNR